MVSLDPLLQLCILQFQLSNLLVLILGIHFNLLHGELGEIALLFNVRLQAALVQAVDATLGVIVFKIECWATKG